jgi:hypothetical protein
VAAALGLSGVPALPGQVIGGFLNSTQSQNFYYAVGFVGIDFYGYLVDGIPAECVFPFSVQTADIQGFLNGSKCFIATAAFRTADSIPLVLLRQFRDHFLEKFGLGRSFVHWYYGWSPKSAGWLIENPGFRFPVLLALIPLEALAWLILHPAVLTFLLMVALSILGYGVSSRGRELRG